MATSSRVVDQSNGSSMAIGFYLCVLLSILGVLDVVTSAQFQMPDAKTMSGIPRPVTDLPNGTVSVRLIRGQLSNNITDFPVELHIGSDVRTVKTDEAGRAEFGNLPPGTTVKAVAVVDGERLESQEFPAPSQGGIRLMLVATDKAARPATEPDAPAVTGQVVIGGQSRIILEPGEDGVSVYYLLDITNNARVPVNPPTPFAFEMPAAAAILDGSSTNAKASGKSVNVAGPFPPGRTLVQAAAQVPVDGASIELTQRFPANFEQLSVIVRKVGDTKLISPQLSNQQDMTAQGETFISAVGRSVAAGQPITLTVDNLPHHSSIPRWTALVLAGLIIVAGVSMSKPPEQAFNAASARKELVERRERLFADLVRLEHDREKGRMNEDRYAARRDALVASLEHVYGELDDGASRSELAGQPA